MIVFFYLPINKIFTSSVICRSFCVHDKANENSSLEFEIIPNWIVVLTEQHKKSIKIKREEGIIHQLSWCQHTFHASQLAGRGTKEHTRLGWPFFVWKFVFLENYDVLWCNDCFKRKKTPQNGNQVSPRLFKSNFRPSWVTGPHCFTPVTLSRL